jgi:hypothetical protein
MFSRILFSAVSQMCCTLFYHTEKNIIFIFDCFPITASLETLLFTYNQLIIIFKDHLQKGYSKSARLHNITWKYQLQRQMFWYSKVKGYHSTSFQAAQNYSSCLGLHKTSSSHFHTSPNNSGSHTHTQFFSANFTIAETVMEQNHCGQLTCIKDSQGLRLQIKGTMVKTLSWWMKTMKSVNLIRTKVLSAGEVCI